MTPAFRGSSSGMPGLDLADEVRAHVGGLRVDPAAELGEERDERGAEAEADDEERRDGRPVEPAERREHAVDAEERERDDEEARDGTAAHRDLDGLDEAALRCGRGPEVGLDGDVHADDAGGHRARGADEEGDAGADPQVDAEDVRVGDLLSLDERDDRGQDDGAEEREDHDRRVLPADEGDRALEDRRRDVLHRLGPLIATQDVPREVEREEDRDEARGQDDELERLGVHLRVGRPPCGQLVRRRGRRPRQVSAETARRARMSLGGAAQGLGECIGRRVATATGGAATGRAP